MVVIRGSAMITPMLYQTTPLHGACPYGLFSDSESENDFSMDDQTFSRSNNVGSGKEQPFREKSESHEDSYSDIRIITDANVTQTYSRKQNLTDADVTEMLLESILNEVEISEDSRNKATLDNELLTNNKNKNSESRIDNHKTSNTKEEELNDTTAGDISSPHNHLDHDLPEISISNNSRVEHLPAPIVNPTVLKPSKKRVRKDVEDKGLCLYPRAKRSKKGPKIVILDDRGFKVRKYSPRYNYQFMASPKYDEFVKKEVITSRRKQKEKKDELKPKAKRKVRVKRRRTFRDASQVKQ